MLFLLANLALAFYNVGIVWAHEVDIFRSWTFLELNTFRRVQAAHWRKLPYWLLAPVALSLLGAITLIQGPLLAKILRTHWIRTGLVSASALILFAWTVRRSRRHERIASGKGVTDMGCVSGDAR